MISSAIAITPGGMVRPSALAVFEIEDQLELGRLPNRHVCRVLALEYSTCVDADQAKTRPYCSLNSSVRQLPKAVDRQVQSRWRAAGVGWTRALLWGFRFKVGGAP